jgi:hypothetical protein
MAIGIGEGIILSDADDSTCRIGGSGVALIVPELVVMTILLPGLSATRRRRSRQPTSDNPQPSWAGLASRNRWRRR